MNIIIVGAGEIGTHIALSLAAENHRIVVIEAEQHGAYLTRTVIARREAQAAVEATPRSTALTVFSFGEARRVGAGASVVEFVTLTCRLPRDLERERHRVVVAEA